MKSEPWKWTAAFDTSHPTSTNMYLYSTCAIQDYKEPSVAWAHLSTCRIPPLLSTQRRQPFRENGRVQDRRRRGREHPPRKTALFSGLLEQWQCRCSFRCVLYQYRCIACERNDLDISPEELTTWYVKLQEVGNVHGIDLVTLEHVVTQVNLSIVHAKCLR